MQTQDPLIGATIADRYRILSRLGSGGMSSVYLARHVLIDRLVAIKTLREELAEDDTQRERFLREGRAVNRINHPHIVEIVDVGEWHEVVFLVMEFVPGDSLGSLIQVPFSPRRALTVTSQIASALARAHQMGVIHRDLKPDNVLVMQQGGEDFVKVLDFGLAKVLDARTVTRTDELFGTPGYIAPELLKDGSVVDGRSDLYSLGVLLYELLTGHLPFEYRSPADLLVMHLTEPPVPPQERVPTLSPVVNALVLQLLEKDPNDRFRDAFHLVDAIEETLSLLSEKSLEFSIEESEAEPEDEERATFLDLPPASIDPSPPLDLKTALTRLEGHAQEIPLSDPRRAFVTRALGLHSRLLEAREESAPDRTERDALSKRAADVRTALGEEIDQLALQISRIERSLATELPTPPTPDADVALWERASKRAHSQSQSRELATLAARRNALIAQLEQRNVEMEARLIQLDQRLSHATRRISALEEELFEAIATLDQQSV